MVLRRKCIQGVEVEVQDEHILIVDPWQTCVLSLFLHVIVDIDPFDNSRFGEEHPLVCYHFMAPPFWNLHHQLALQSSKT